MDEKVQVATKKPEVKRENPTSHTRNADQYQSMSSPVDQVLYLQRTIGNQAVQWLIKSGTLQAKLKICQPGDKYEQEADRVADAVMRMPELGVQRQVEPEEDEEETLQTKPLANQITPLVQVQRQEEPEEEEEMLQAKQVAKEITPLVQRQAEPEEEEEELQVKATSGNISEVTPNFESNILSLRGGGQPLPKSERAYFEPRFGQDFSQVRVHTGSHAAETARSINAKAFTVGHNIAFGSGQYSPESSEGRQLLAHELTHVIQQSGQRQILQRFVVCEGPEQCPRRERGELRRSRSTPHQVEIYQPTTFGVLISNFEINEHQVKPVLASNSIWITLVGRIGSTSRGEWEILGFSDCQGSETTNRSLRNERATEVRSILPSTATARVRRVNAANLTDCISNNSNESGRSRNRSVLIRRLPGSTGPTAPTPPRPIGPVRSPRSPGNFCVSYSSSIEAAAARLWLQTAWLNFAHAQFGIEVHNLWRDYLNRPKGSSLAPRVFRGRGNPIVDAFRTDPQTVRHQRLLYADIRAVAARTPEANVPFTGNSYTSPLIPLGTLLPAAALIRTINYRDPRNRIPGNIAGGTGVMGTSSSDAGPDLRLFTGTVRILRTRPIPSTPEVKTARIEMQLQVIDAVDFCPGAAGGTLAQLFTIPMSRLEATPTELTYDLPFHVFVDLSDTVLIP